MAVTFGPSGFDRDLTDIFAIQDEITRAIVEQLKVASCRPQEQKWVAQAPTDSVEAYTYHLRGQGVLGTGAPNAGL